MKLKVEGGRIVASLADEGRQDVFFVDASFRCADGKILPSVVFAERPGTSPAQATADMRRVVSVLGPAQVIPLGGHAFPLEQPKTDTVGGHGGRPRSFQKLKKLGVIGVDRRQQTHGTR